MYHTNKLTIERQPQYTMKMMADAPTCTRGRDAINNAPAHAHIHANACFEHNTGPYVLHNINVFLSI